MADDATQGSPWDEPAVDVEFPTWAALVEYLATEVRPGWIFRGQGAYSWHLESNLVRILRRTKWPIPHWEMAERSGIGYFKEHARRELADAPAELDLVGWLSLMRHYGAPTRLLDWSASPFVAAFFAFEDATATDDRALWALHAVYSRIATGPPAVFPYDETGTFPSFEEGDADREFPRFFALETTRSEVQNRRLRDHLYSRHPWPMPILPPAPDARMSAQQAVFTATGELRRPVDDLFAHSKYKRDGAVRSTLANLDQTQPAEYFRLLGIAHQPVTQKWQMLRRVKLPYSWRREALETLERMGITRASLFPGLDGIGLATARHLERPHPLRDLLAPTPQAVDLPDRNVIVRPP